MCVESFDHDHDHGALCARMAACRQDGLDAALRSGSAGEVRVPRATVERAASLWESAATLLDSWSEAVGDDDEADRQAARLRARVRSLRQALVAE